MELLIKQITYQNFKGLRNYIFKPEGKSINVFADNGCFKSTLYDGFLWLLFNRDSQGRTNFEVKTLNPDGTPIHGLEHSVEAVLNFGGRDIALKKVFKEKWVKRRGNAKAEFTGHETSYWVNDVPVKKSEYEVRISELVDENIFRLLTDPRYFNNLHWTERRKLLLNVCGNMSDKEVIQSDKSLSKLSEILQGHSMEDHRKIITARRSEINKELDKIPVRIDEVELSLLDVFSEHPESLFDDIQNLKAALQEKQQELARVESGGEIAEKTKKLRKLEAELIDLKNQHRNKYEAEIQEKQKLLNEVKEKCSDLLTAIRGMEKSTELCHEKQASIGNKLTTLRAKWHEINDQQLELELDEVCPTCGQPLPAEKLAEAREKALAQFNREKAEKLEQITAEGKRLIAQGDKLAAEIFGLEKKIKEARAEIEAEEKAVEQLQSEIDALRKKMEFATANDRTYNAKYLEKLDIEKAISSLKENNAEAVAKIKEEIKEIELDIATLEQETAKVERRKQGQKRIEELKEQERKLAAEYEKLEEELYLTEQFIRTKVNLLEEKINSKFKMARFKLFDVQVNGAVVECCETTYQGVPYSSLNNGARINIGLDIINTLSEHYGFDVPIFIDNAEAVTQLTETRGQQIKLFVSEADKKLRVEHVDKKEKIKEAV